MDISTDGAKLYIQLPFLDASQTPYDHELVPTQVDNFTVAVAGTARPLTFLADSKGVYKYLRSRPYLAVRTASP